MENKNISQIALDRIKKEGIKPISRNIFSIKRVLFWTIVFLSLIVGSFAFSLVLSSLFNNDWDLYGKFGFKFIINTLPYFWLISMIVFTVLGEFYYRKTILGHRRGVVIVVGVYMFSTAVIGSSLYLLKVDGIFERSINNMPPSYGNILMNRHQFWSDPDEGLISGQIIFADNNIILLTDSNNFTWDIDISSASVKPRVNLDVGERIKIIGDKVSENSFYATEIRPWMGANSQRSLDFMVVDKKMR